jgi:UPF0755 protein
MIFLLPNSSADGKARIVTIPRGASFHATVDSLESSGLLRSRLLFDVAARLMGKRSSIKAGKYKFESGVSNYTLLYDLDKGESRLVITVIIPEGTRIRTIARRFAEELGTNEEKFLKLCTDSAFKNKLNIDAPSLEGYLLPDAYSFYWQPDEAEVIRTMVHDLMLFYVDSLKERQKALGMSFHEILTMASIVEGETGKTDERARVAGVYFNRLHRKIKLEADPTVQYSINGKPRRLRYKDYRINHEYNTYIIYGLPPGPVNNPGRAAIIASLFPEKHNYIFFVANGYGGHRFSETFSEHQKNIQKYRRVRRELLRLQKAQG